MNRSAAVKNGKIISLVLGLALIVFELIGCSPMNSPEESDPMESLNKLFIDEKYPSDWYSLLSPDGKWLVQGPFLHQDPLRITSTGTDQVKLQMDANQEVGWGQFDHYWSPDSTRLAVLGLEEIGKCAYDRIILYHITEDRQLKRFIYRFPEEEANCLGTAWAPDSSQIAVSTGNKLYILDDQAQLIKNIYLNEIDYRTL